MALFLVPATLEEANAVVRRLHRHHRPVPGAKFCIGVSDGRTGMADEDYPKFCGVLIAGRPIARGFDDGVTLEVTRCATDGTRNAASLLYGAARRATFALGYRRLITYTRADESGASLRGAGWKVIAERPARSWARSSKARPRDDQSEPYARLLWEASA